MKLGLAILARLGLAAQNDEPDAFEKRLEGLTNLSPAQHREHGVFKNRASHLAA